MIIPKKWQICFMLFLATVLNYLDRQTMSILAPRLQQEMHLDNEALGWLFAVFYYTYTISHMLVGLVLDRVNLRWAYLIAVVLWSLVAALTGTATSFVTLLMFRLLLGVAESANWPSAINVVARVVEPKERAMGNGLFTSGTSVAALVSPMLILGIAGALGWRWTFVLVGSLGAFWAVAWILVTRGKALEPIWSSRTGSARWSWAGQLTIFRSIVRSPRFLPVLLVVILVNPCLYFSVNWLPTYFSQERGVTPGQHMGWMLTAIYLGLDLGNLASGAAILLLTRRGMSPRIARRVVLVFATSCMVWCAAVPRLSTPWAIAALVAFNFGQGIWQTVSLTMEQEVSETHISTALGMISGCGSFAGAIAMWEVGRITRATGSFSAPMIAVGVAATLAAICGWVATKNLEAPKSTPA